MHFSIRFFLSITEELAGVMATMVLAILFQGIGMIVGTAGAMMKKKLGGGVAVLHLLAGTDGLI